MGWVTPLRSSIVRPVLPPALIRIMYMPIMLRLAGLFLMSERKRNVKLNLSALLLVVQFVRFANWRPAIHGNFCNNHSFPTHWKNRYTPDGLQDVIKAMAKRWRRKRKTALHIAPVLPIYSYQKCTKMAQSTCMVLFRACPYRLCPLYNVRCQQRQKLPGKSAIKSAMVVQYIIAKNGNDFSALTRWSLLQT